MSREVKEPRIRLLSGAEVDYQTYDMILSLRECANYMTNEEYSTFKIAAWDGDKSTLARLSEVVEPRAEKAEADQVIYKLVGLLDRAVLHHESISEEKWDEMRGDITCECWESFLNRAALYLGTENEH